VYGHNCLNTAIHHSHANDTNQQDTIKQGPIMKIGPYRGVHSAKYNFAHKNGSLRSHVNLHENIYMSLKGLNLEVWVVSTFFRVQSKDRS
jgi:hypothetical protein